MAHVVFNGLLRVHRNQVIDEAMSGMLEHSRRMVLRLRQWLADDDGWIIARMLLDPYAESGAARVFDSMIRDSANRQFVFPECGLPFEGNTRWQARCTELQMNDAPKRWLIQELISCSAPFPFDELEIFRDNDGRKAQNPEDDLPEDEKRPAWAGPRKVAKPGPEIEVQSATPPDASIVVVETSLASERFEALRGKQVIKTPKSECHYTSYPFGNLQAINALSTGESAALESDVAPLSVSWDRKQEGHRTTGLRTSFKTLLQVVDALNTLGGVACVRPPLVAIEYLPLSKPSQYGQWSYLDSRTKTRRATIVVDIAYQGIQASLVEFELRIGERCQAALFVSMGAEYITNAELALLFHPLVEFEGVWANIKSLPQGVTLRLIRHTKPSAATFAEVICAVIKS